MQKDDARAIGYLSQVLYLYPSNTQAGLIFGYGAVDVSEIKQGVSALRTALQG